MTTIRESSWSACSRPRTVVFVNDLNDHRRRSLSARLRRPVLAAVDLTAAGFTDALRSQRSKTRISKTRTRTSR
ncbi:hypothetical protein QEZ54_19670 [Catellatospora sp. KI3]|uniref:hypothetical protein n=1 Tax=Catellatospora sp. KI3 TaxID=3041620 RepID=UPI002482E689|nr:hypothetical protein [Catellatospora sp. KI3]MDI1463203.1 hypothetical protein [Catellatospora sp. KI3]